MSDTDERRAGSVILKDLALFNKTSALFEFEIGPAIFTAIGDLVDAWLKNNGWEGEPEYLRGIWVCPVNWKGVDEEPFAKFRFGIRPGTKTKSYDLADQCGVGQTVWGFTFEVTHSWFGGKPAWNTFAKGLGVLTDDVVKKGWINEGKGAFFRPVTLNAKCLTPAWEADDWTEFLAPLQNALDALVADQALFDNIIKKADPKSGRSAQPAALLPKTI